MALNSILRHSGGIILIELKGDIWTSPQEYKIIRTNGFVRADGTSVMHKGEALAALTTYPIIGKEIAEYVRQFGNIPMKLEPYRLITFPIKNHWMDEPDVELIKQSAIKVYNLLPRETTAAMLRPSKKLWKDIKPEIENVLDDRFYVYTK